MYVCTDTYIYVYTSIHTYVQVKNKSKVICTHPKTPLVMSKIGSTAVCMYCMYIHTYNVGKRFPVAVGTSTQYLSSATTDVQCTALIFGPFVLSLTTR